MQVIDFDQAFRAGETSARIIEFPIMGSQASLTICWENNSTWGKCEFVDRANRTYVPKVIISTHDLPPGEYQDTLVISRECILNKFTVKFTVVPINSYNLPTPPPNSIDRPPKLVTIPQTYDLGIVEIGEQVPFQVQIFNVGGPVWDHVRVGWDRHDQYAATTTEFTVSKSNNGQEFPIDIKVVFDTNRAQPNISRQYTIVIVAGKTLLKIPITYQTVARVPPVLVLEPKKIYTEVWQGHNVYVNIVITKTGSKPTKFNCRWGTEGFTWHKGLTWEPDDLITFPKVLGVCLNSANLVPGDYRDTVHVSTDNENYDVPVVFRVLPSE